MVKKLARALIFTFISLYAINYIFNVLSYASGDFLVILIGFTLFHAFTRPLLSLVGFPSKGISYFLIKTVLLCVLLFVFVSFVPFFYIKPAYIYGLTVVGYDIPGITLASNWATIVLAFILNSIFGFFDWMCDTSGK